MRQAKQSTVTMKLIAGVKTCRACTDKIMRLHVSILCVLPLFLLPSLHDVSSCTLRIPDANKACQDAKGAANGATAYYLPHPYKCDKYIWCFSSGDQGVEQPCPGDLMFNPQYTDNTDLCIAADAVTQCKQN